jgi:hypothetical protein
MMRKKKINRLKKKPTMKKPPKEPEVDNVSNTPKTYERQEKNIEEQSL